MDSQYTAKKSLSFCQLLQCAPASQLAENGWSAVLLKQGIDNAGAYVLFFRDIMHRCVITCSASVLRRKTAPLIHSFNILHGGALYKDFFLRHFSIADIIEIIYFFFFMLANIDCNTMKKQSKAESTIRTHQLFNVP